MIYFWQSHSENSQFQESKMDQILTLAHFICSSFELLADESRNLFQAEKKITADQIHKMKIIFIQNDQKFSFWVKIGFFYNT